MLNAGCLNAGDAFMTKWFWRSLLTLCVLGFAVSNRPAFAQSPVWLQSVADNDGTQYTARAEWLYFTRGSTVSDVPNVINGPDAARLSFNDSDFDLEHGYRVTLGAQNTDYRIEAVFADYGNWNWQNAGTLNAGLSFDEGLGTSWPAGANSIDTTTFFQPLHIAADGGLGGEADEHDGLGPNAALADPAPTYNQFYNSNIRDIQANLLTNDACSNFQFGLGYRNLQVDESAGVSITGTFRATDIGVPTGGLSHATLTGVAGLNFLGGTPNGIEDESLPGNNGAPDQLTISESFNTTNDLNGFQAIVSASLLKTCRFNLNAIVRGGAYHNHARGTAVYRYTGVGDDTSIYGRTATNSNDVVSFVGGAGLQTGYCITPNLRLVGGYNVIFVSGVALAPNQVDSFTSAGRYRVNTEGNIFAHGGNLGLEYLF